MHKSNADKYPPDPTYYQADFAIYDAGRMRQKNGKGYYRYEPGDRSRYDDPEAIEILRNRAWNSTSRSGSTAMTKSWSAACTRC